MITSLILAATLTSQAPAKPPAAAEAKPAPRTAQPVRDPLLAELKAFATQEVDPTLSKAKQAAFRKKQSRAKTLYHQRLRYLDMQAQAAAEQAEYERLLPLILQQRQTQAVQSQAAAAQRNAAANEANARANARNADTNRQRLLREQYPQFYGGR